MIRKWIKVNQISILLFFLSLSYFLFLFQYYNIEFHVPDLGAYYAFSLIGEKAKDGFSSMFIFMSSLLAKYPIIIIGQLLFLTCSIFIIMYVCNKAFIKEKIEMIIFIVFTLTCSFWYYFYGKIFYDFPFTAITYSIGLLVMMNLLNCKNEKKIKIYWMLIAFVGGFCLSWKPYNIFLIAGLGMLMICNDVSRKICLAQIKRIPNILKSIVLFIFGYVLGNYNLICYPQETIFGLKAYKASSDFETFLMRKEWIIWDHVNGMSFNKAVMCVVTAVIILFILPIIVKKYRYLICSSIMVLCFYVFITYFSPGFPWHGFTFGLFILTFLMFIMGESKKLLGIRKKVFIISIVIATCFQIFTCFGEYVPKQIRWHNVTKTSIEILQKEEKNIYEDVKKISSTIDEKYMIDVAIKRYKLTKEGEFVDPLLYNSKSKEKWNEIYNSLNYSKDNNPDYIIYIIPNNFKVMEDVADIHKYDNHQKISEVLKEDYSIYLYRNIVV